MPGHFAQKILKKIGLDDQQDQGPQQQPYNRPPPPPPSNDARMPGNRMINNDEHLLTSHPQPNGTYARLCRLHDGGILGSYTRFEGPERRLKVSKSVDGGRTFQDFGEVAKGTGDIDNMFLLEIAPNTVLAAFRNHDQGGPHGFTWFRITVCRSTNGGRDWHYVTQAAEKKPPMGIWEPFMRIGNQGEVQMTYSHEFAPDNQCTMLVRSFDGGQSWTEPQCLDGRQDPFRDGMTGIAKTVDNGREVLVLVFETTRFGPFNIEALLSYDDGQTWGWRHMVYQSPNRRNAGSPQIAAFGDGSLAVVIQTDEDIPQPHWHHRSNIKVVFAAPPQEGRIFWTRPTMVCPELSHWPSIMAVDHQTLLATYESKGAPKTKSITLHM